MLLVEVLLGSVDCVVFDMFVFWECMDVVVDVLMLGGVVFCYVVIVI